MLGMLHDMHGIDQSNSGLSIQSYRDNALRSVMLARPITTASYLVSVRRDAISLHASFRRSLAIPPLRFTRASPPSGCTGDLHPQTAGHARHTSRCAPASPVTYGQD